MIDMVGRGGDQFDAVIPADQLIGERSIISKAGWNSAARSADYETALTGGAADRSAHPDY